MIQLKLDKYLSVLYGSIWSKFWAGAKNSNNRTSKIVYQISNVLTSSQPQLNINATHFAIYHNKNALKSPGNTSGTFLNFLIFLLGNLALFEGQRCLFFGCATSFKNLIWRTPLIISRENSKITKNDDTSSPMLPEQLGPDGRPSV